MSHLINTATETQIAQSRLSGAEGQLKKSLRKASSTEPPYSDDISVRRGIQAAKDIIKVEKLTLTELNSGTTLPFPLATTPEPLKTWLTPPSFFPVGFNILNGF